jgi:hypothetical protein
MNFIQLNQRLILMNYKPQSISQYYKDLKPILFYPNFNQKILYHL